MTERRGPLVQAIALLAVLKEDELLALHRECCRRAAAVYGPRYQDAWRLGRELAKVAGRA